MSRVFPNFGFCAEEAAMKTLDLVQEAIAQARRYELYCTPTEKAVEAAKVMLE